MCNHHVPFTNLGSSKKSNKEKPFDFIAYLCRELILRRQAFLIKPSAEDDSPPPSELQARMMHELKAELMRLGYALSAELMEAFHALSEQDFHDNALLLIHALEEIKGDKLNFSPLHADFPHQKGSNVYQVKRFISMFEMIYPFWKLVEPSEDGEKIQLSCGCHFHPELFDLDKFNACPVCQRQIEELGASLEGKKQGSAEYAQRVNIVPPIQLVLPDETLAFEIFTNLLESNSSISPSDIEFITQMTAHHQAQVAPYIPCLIPQKEQLCLIQALLIRYAPEQASQVADHFKTATDVMRLAVFLSGGLASLEWQRKFKFKMSRAQRSAIIRMLDQTPSPLEDMKRRRGLFLTLGKYLHVGAEAKKYPHAAQAFDILRNNPQSITSFQAKKERLILQVKEKQQEQESFDALVDLLASRPGEFARSLDLLLREASALGQEQVDQCLNSLAQQVLAKMKFAQLFALKSYFQTRTSKSEFRAFIPKSSQAKILFYEDDNRAVIPEEIVSRVTTLFEAEIHTRLKGKESLGSVYLSSDLKNITLPLAMRSASKALRVYPRASRVPLTQECGTLRMYMYWKGNADFDLSAVAFQSNWDYVSASAFWESRKQEWAQFAGDIQHAPKGAAECIDIHIEAAKKMNIRYICMFVNVYRGECFDAYHAFVGVMESKDQLTGAHFEPSAAVNRMDLTGDSMGSLPLILDLETMEYIVADLRLSVHQFRSAFSEKNKLVEMSRAVLRDSRSKPTLYELMEAHALARAESIVRDVELQEAEDEATPDFDYRFDADFAFKLDEIMATWLSDET